MGATTAISWADATVNFWMGCTAVSPACDGCYARALVQDRFGKAEWGGPGAGAGTRTRTGATSWNLPFKLHRKAEREGTRPFVFVNSLADIFDNQVPAEWRREAFDVMRRTPRLVYLLLTKRPSMIAKLAAEAGGLPPNAAIGTTVEDQERADRNVPDLLEASEELWRAGTRPLFNFLSCEPLLGPVNLTAFQDYPESPYFTDALKGTTWMKAGTNTIPGTSHIVGDRDHVGLCHRIEWVITGGETDQGAHKARPTHPDWFRSLREQCAKARVQFHHKQNGEWAPGECGNGGLTRTEEVATFYEEGWDNPGWDFDRVTRRQSQEMHRDDEPDVWRMGKNRSGRLLDGALHDARPAVPAVGGAHE